jgi:hypothetical protein
MTATGNHRPRWQRIVLPICGVLLCLVGIAGCIMPIVPGFPLLLIGFPMLFCFNQEWEKWARGQIKRLGRGCKHAYTRVRNRLRGRHS